MRRVLALIALACSINLVACAPAPGGSALPMTAQTTPTISANTTGLASLATPAQTIQPIAKLQLRGGECEPAQCERTYTIYSDGLVELERGGKPAGHRIADSADIASLRALLTHEQVAQLKQQPFRGTCPLAVDGQEHVYTFYLASGPEEIADCTYAVPTDHPLVATLQSFIKRYEPPVSTATPMPRASAQLPLEDQAPLIQVRFVGGICPDEQPCHITHTFMQDTISQAGGSYVLEAYKLPAQATVLADADMSELQAIIREVARNSFDKAPLTERCPNIPPDALLPTYTFFTPDGQVVRQECPEASDRINLTIQRVDTLINRYTTQP